MSNSQASVVYYPGYAQEQVHQNFLVQTITAIANSNPMVVTTASPHNCLAGLNVSFLIPVQFGMYQLNILNGTVLSVTSNTLTISIDSLGFSPFAYPLNLPKAYTPPTVIPNSSSYAPPPSALPYGNQNAFEGTIYNNGSPGDPVNGA